MTTEDFIKRTPISYGYWTGERGNSKFVVTDEGIEKYLQNGGFKDINSDREIIKSLFKKYRINGIKYKNGIPDFSPVCEFSVTLPSLSTDSSEFSRLLSLLFSSGTEGSLGCSGVISDDVTLSKHA